jgi:4-hydroxy-tetrahydrodipicolinate reductase
MPGMLNDAMPTFLAGWVGEVDRIWMRERTYEGEYGADIVTLRDLMGFSTPIEEFGTASERGRATIDAYQWFMRQSAHAIGTAMGVPIDEFRLTAAEPAPAPRDLVIKGCDLHIPRGSLAGFRFEFTGFTEGRPWQVLEIQSVACLDLGPPWQTDPSELAYTIKIDGDPSIQCHWGWAELEDTLNSISARAVNLASFICAADPGWHPFWSVPINQCTGPVNQRRGTLSTVSAPTTTVRFG